MPVRLLVDSDVLVKMAHWGLLDAIPSAFDLDWPAAATLESLRFRARRADPKLFRSPDVSQELLSRLERVGDLPAADQEVVRALQGVVDIDSGELQLIAACLGQPNSLLLTGDKRALRALANPDLAAIATAMKGRVVCLEQLLLVCARTAGADQVIRGICTHRDLDQAARAVVGVHGCTEEHLFHGLMSYVNHLRAETGSLLLPD